MLEDEAARLADLLQRMDRDELVRRIRAGSPSIGTVLDQLVGTSPASPVRGRAAGGASAAVQAGAPARADLVREPAITSRHHQSGLARTPWETEARRAKLVNALVHWAIYLTLATGTVAVACTAGSTWDLGAG